MASLVEPAASSSSNAASPSASSPSFLPNVSSPARKKRDRQLSRNSRPPGSADGLISHPSSPVRESRMLPSTSFDSDLPLFLNGTSSHMSSTRNNQARRHRPHSMREPSSRQRQSVLPSHHDHFQQENGSPHRGERLDSLSMAGQHAASRSSPGWTHRARRWSTAVSSGSSSVGIAHRLAEGASPYLRAGLDELRSIFDVDSDPIPISALDEDDSVEEEEWDQQERSEVYVNLNTPPVKGVERDPFLHSPIRLSHKLPERAPAGSGLTRSTSLSSNRSSKSKSHSQERPEKTGLRAEDGMGEMMFSAASLGINRGILAWSLAAVAIGLTALCAYGYALQSDTFSITLLVFFITQPAFALMGLIALIMRRRALMDLSSRAMRAHVLAQACIVVLAYLDLSASSFYMGRGNQAPFQMVPTLEMRFGPARGAIQAGDTPGIGLLYNSRSSAMRSVSLDGENSSVHAHDTHVGDLQSRLTHLIVFLVQAAFPILAIFIGQYVVAQRLAWLARRTTVSRQNSMNKHSEQSSPTMSKRLSVERRRFASKTLPASIPLSTEKMLSRSAREFGIPFSPSSTQPSLIRPKPQHAGHTRSLSQPLDFLSTSSKKDKPTSSLSGFRESEHPILSQPFSKSPSASE